MLTKLEDEGYLFPIDIMNAAEVTLNRTHFDELMKLLGDRPGSDHFKQLHLYQSWVYKLVTHEKILDIVESILGPNLLVHSSSFFCKYPYSDGFIPWHQDGVYWGLNKQDLCSVWLAISDSRVENGCMRVIPKSHKTKLEHFEQEDDKILLSSGLTLSNGVAEDEIVNIELKAGQISLHNQNIAHSSENNKTDSYRMGFAIRYINTEFKQTLPHFDVVLARGKDEFGNYSKLSTPPSTDLLTAIKIQKESQRNYLKERAGYLNPNV
jgi:non-heme Fe2+,alpha-ketoglutarate-dependent halogenase